MIGRAGDALEDGDPAGVRSRRFAEDMAKMGPAVEKLAGDRSPARAGR